MALSLSNKPSVYQTPFALSKDESDDVLRSREHASVAKCNCQSMLKVELQAQTRLAQQAFHDAAFMLRVSHQKQVAAIPPDREPATTINT